MKLSDFPTEPTRVNAEEKTWQPQSACAVFVVWLDGWEGYCRECLECLMVQQMGDDSYPVRVFCAGEKCVK